ncbi:MAG: hypothetical protein ACKVU1_04855 [bacterium]
MKGLFLNVEHAESEIARIDSLIGTRAHITKVGHTAFGQIVVNHHPVAWPDGPVIDARSEGIFAAASGWFSFRGRLGDLRAFARAFAGARTSDERERVLAEIDAGAFVILIDTPAGPAIVTDPFGLHPHYFVDTPLSRIAPSPHFLKDGRAQHAGAAAILRAKNHLFGNLTAYEGIERLEPGSVITRGGVARYFRYESGLDDARRLPATLGAALTPFAAKKTILPISGGLDSRLIALCGRFDYGYTFGPRDTGDRPVARRFASRFGDYREFSLLELDYPQAHRDAANMIFDGVCEKPFAEVVSVYRHLHAAWGADCFFFDGYLGDVLQRATYLTYGGVAGSIAKLLPWITLARFDALTILRRRHAKLSPESFRVVADCFERTVGTMPIDAPHKLLLFEILYGRGARYSINGGSVLSGQYWPAVQAFFLPPAFRLLFGQDMAESLFYRTVRRAWSEVPRDTADVPTYSGFKPHWNAHRSRATMLVVKGLGKAGLYNRAVSYESEIPRIRWS